MLLLQVLMLLIPIPLGAAARMKQSAEGREVTDKEKTISLLSTRDDAIADSALAFTIKKHSAKEPEWRVKYSGAQAYAAGGKERLEIKDHLSNVANVYCWNGKEYSFESRPPDGDVHVERGTSPEPFFRHANLPYMFGVTLLGSTAASMLSEPGLCIEEGVEKVLGQECKKYLLLKRRRSAPPDSPGVPYATIWLDTRTLLLMKAETYIEILPPAEAPLEREGYEYGVDLRFEVLGSDKLGSVYFPTQFKITGVSPRYAPGYEAITTIDLQRSIVGKQDGARFLIGSRDGVPESDQATGRTIIPGSWTKEGATIGKIRYYWTSLLSPDESESAQSQIFPGHEDSEFIELNCADICLKLKGAMNGIPLQDGTALTTGAAVHDRTIESVQAALVGMGLEAEVHGTSWSDLAAIEEPTILFMDNQSGGAHYSMAARSGEEVRLVMPSHGHTVTLRSAEDLDQLNSTFYSIGRPSPRSWQKELVFIAIAIGLFVLAIGSRRRQGQAVDNAKRVATVP